MSDLPVTIHAIDRGGTIVQVNPAWLAFARDNGYPGDPRAVVGASLWERIGDPGVAHIYRELVQRACGDAGPVRLEYRCDSPDQRRFMEMIIQCEPGSGLISFVNRALRIEARPPQWILDPSRPRSQERFLRLCGWCKRAELAGDWVEIEQAVARLRLFDEIESPRLTHGICPGCIERVRAVL